jgi:uncharacterized membrane protein HdeD (DUF308 family)
MWNHPIEKDLFESFGKNAKIAGVIFLLLGVIGIVFPTFMTLATVVFVSWLLLFAGMVSGYFTYITYKKDWLGWLKSLILVGIALYMLLFPMSGVATVGLLLSIYFFMDAFAGFVISSNAYPHKRWWMWGVNGLLSFGLGIFFILGWPFSSLYLIGIFVGISLFFDGMALLVSAKFFQDMTKL